MKQPSKIFQYPRRAGQKAIAGLIIAGSFGFLVQCAQKDDLSYNEEEMYSSAIGVTVTEPIDRDFDSIAEEGVIRMISRFSSGSYFLHRGEEKGFEFEFARSFSQANNLRLEVVIAANDEHLIDLLNSGRGDFIAANYSITNERLNYIGFSDPYNFVDQVIVFREGERPLMQPADLNGMEIAVRKGSAYIKSLQRMKREYDLNFKIEILPAYWDTEAIMLALAEGEYQATVADHNLFQAATHYISGITAGLVLDQENPIAWGIRNNAPVLSEKMNSFVKSHFWLSEADVMPRRSAFMNVLRRRYFDNRPPSYTMRSFTMNQVTGYEGILSPYDELIIPIAEAGGVDWKLVVAVMAQESRFDPYAESRMGAIGLMQIIPRFSQVEEHMLWDPELNIREGVRYLQKHLRHYDYMDPENQLAFALATYNAGMGHMADARRLTVDRNRDPNNWDDVAQSLLLLMQPRFFQNARFGFVRGTEPVNYVRDIKKRYNMYQNMALFASEDPILQRREQQHFIP
ncbi:MAG: transporter substrate-binding domain-containing protein [Balneolales bacterium]|nr:transporter substrate-binding domain-containing protein [Balneolales bacterium]